MQMDPWYQQRENEKMREAQREIWKAAAKAEAIEQTRLNFAAAKLRMKEEEAERKKQIFEQIGIDEEGNITLITKNLTISPKKRSLCNMKSPALTKLVRVKAQEDCIFCMSCLVNEKWEKIYLAEEKLGNGGYILKKITSAGGIFYLEKQSACKRFAVDLISILLLGAKEVFVPDTPGWMKLPSGKFKFVEEEDLSWKWIQKKSR